jgi:hypothetical protein
MPRGRVPLKPQRLHAATGTAVRATSAADDSWVIAATRAKASERNGRTRRRSSVRSHCRQDPAVTRRLYSSTREAMSSSGRTRELLPRTAFIGTRAGAHLPDADGRASQVTSDCARVRSRALRVRAAHGFPSRSARGRPTRRAASRVRGRGVARGRLRRPRLRAREGAAGSGNRRGRLRIPFRRREGWRVLDGLSATQPTPRGALPQGRRTARRRRSAGYGAPTPFALPSLRPGRTGSRATAVRVRVPHSSRASTI